MAELKRRGMKPQELTRIQTASDPQLSPDGTQVAFVVTTLSEARDEYLSNIWLVSTEGGTPRRFTTGERRDTSPRWSPDGSRLAFVSERGEMSKPQLYVMQADGGEPVALTALPNGVSDPVWSPDGLRLVVVSRVGGWQEPEDEDERHKSKPARVIRTMKYKSNGEGFIYDRRQHLFVVSVDGGDPWQITDGDWDDVNPTWSPDGHTLVFASARHPERDYDTALDVWQVPATGGEPQCLTETVGPLGCPVFTPGGQTLAYLGHHYLNDGGRNVRLYTQSVSGGEPTCLTADLDRTCTAFFELLRPQWTSSGDAGFQVLVEDQGCIHIYQVPVCGGKPVAKIVGGNRQVTGYSVAQDGSGLAFTATHPAMPAEVFICVADGTEERQLTDLNRSWRDEVELSEPQRFRYQRDGVEVDGWVMKPYGWVPGEQYPALLNIHGGPHMSYGETFFDEFQVYAGAGYAVIYTNPRGSQGYGESFTRAVLGDWGGGDYADIMAGLDEALSRCDFIDPERLGVMGGSYGGFMTTWAIGHSQRFQAACSERAVNNVYTLFGTSDIGHSFSEIESGCLPWEDMQWYIDHSPLTYAKAIQTPLLIMHSENDLRCTVEQAEQLFIALKKQRKDVLFVRFPDENHDLSRSGRPRHRLERFRFILEWFETYLKPA